MHRYCKLSATINEPLIISVFNLTNSDNTTKYYLNIPRR